MDDFPATLLQEEENSQTLRFLIMETNCPKSKRRLSSQCAFKLGGEIRVCDVDVAELNMEKIQCQSLTKVLRRNRPPPGRPGGGSVIGVAKEE
ncbi:uncharacterized protein [Hyperolius riggenbachi]